MFTHESEPEFRLFGKNRNPIWPSYAIPRSSYSAAYDLIHNKQSLKAVAHVMMLWQTKYIENSTDVAMVNMLGYGATIHVNDKGNIVWIETKPINDFINKPMSYNPLINPFVDVLYRLIPGIDFRLQCNLYDVMYGEESLSKLNRINGISPEIHRITLLLRDKISEASGWTLMKRSSESVKEENRDAVS